MLRLLISVKLKAGRVYGCCRGYIILFSGFVLDHLITGLLSTLLDGHEFSRGSRQKTT